MLYHYTINNDYNIFSACIFLVLEYQLVEEDFFKISENKSPSKLPTIRARHNSRTKDIFWKKHYLSGIFKVVWKKCLGEGLVH